ncbi:MAG TPA: site-specific DNA-methyltransferase [Candidatus Atribacteria bacterium]|nr:site-specific DNA-methyltransferase [Candidatus Atribacteria bacterium]
MKRKMIDLRLGDCQAELKKMDNESIDCCVTSPPYWGLRDYQTEPLIWDGDESCQHEWEQLQKTLRHKSGETNPGKERWYKDKGASDDKGSNFCTKCGAWQGSLGLEPTFELYIKHLCNIFDEIKRVLKKSGTLWVNIGDSYYGGGHGGWSKFDDGIVNFKDPKYGRGRNDCPVKNWDYSQYQAKCMCLIPSRFAIEMVNRGWILRNEIIWRKPNCMPSSVKDRFTVDFEYVLFFVKNKKYYFEMQYERYNKPMNRWGGNVLKANRESSWNKGTGQETYRNRNMRPNIQGRFKRCVWDIPTRPNSIKGVHFATFPEDLVRPCILAGCPRDGIVLDPFAGLGTTGVVVKKLDRRFIGIELNSKYAEVAQRRINNTPISLC